MVQINPNLLGFFVGGLKRIGRSCTNFKHNCRNLVLVVYLYWVRCENIKFSLAELVYTINSLIISEPFRLLSRSSPADAPSELQFKVLRLGEKE